MSLRVALPIAFFVVFSVTASACSSSGPSGPNGDVFGPPDGGSPAQDGGDTTSDGGKQETDIVFDPSTTFAKRDCSLTLSWSGSASDVKLAGEFTDWATSPLTMTQGGSGFSITLQPSPTLTAGQLYAYKFITDGTWILDPANKYRKIVGGTMNSALMMPDCAAGPELLSDKVTTNASGTMAVKVTVRAASDGASPTRVFASLDRGAVPAGSWKLDGTGGVTFDFSALAKGKHTLSLRTVDGKNREALPIDLPFWIEDEPFDYRDGILYMVMLDRFANGDKTIDKGATGVVEYDADWHGGDLVGALQVLKSGYFEKLGARTIWLSPVNRQTDKSQLGDGGQTYSAYHGYWPVKAREVEPRLGGDAALRAFVAEAHKRGIRVIVDLINNQVHQDHEYVSLHSPWFRTICQCGDNANSCGWSQRPFDCYFQPYLPDINWTVYDAEKQFVSDAVNWISEFDLDGFRVDAVKHVESNSIYDMRAELSRRFEQGGGRVFMVGETAVGEGDSGTFFGETFTDGFDWINAYIGPNALDGQFDFPTRHNMADGLVNGGQALSDVETQVQKSLTRYKAGNLNVRFLNGHDNPRIASIAAQDPKLGCTWASGCRGDQLPPAVYTDPVVYQRLKRGLTVLYSMPGVPYLYMGDEVAFPGGADPDMRRDMRFAETDLAGLQMAKPGTSPAALTSQQIDLRDWVRKLGDTRAKSRALRRGTRTTLLGNDADFWVYAWQSGPKEIAVIAVNRGGAQGRSVGTGSLDLSGVTGWTSALGTGTITPGSGTLQINLGDGEAAIFTAH
jgi:glycosidase